MFEEEFEPIDEDFDDWDDRDYDDLPGPGEMIDWNND